MHCPKGIKGAHQIKIFGQLPRMTCFSSQIKRSGLRRSWLWQGRGTGPRPSIKAPWRGCWKMMVFSAPSWPSLRLLDLSNGVEFVSDWGSWRWWCEHSWVACPFLFIALWFYVKPGCISLYIAYTRVWFCLIRAFNFKDLQIPSTQLLDTFKLL